jgi:uncharacterized protein (DUF58 family)
MQTLIPQSASATAKPLGKTGRVLGYGLTRMAWLLFAAGLLMAIPAFFHPGRIGFMFGWDVLLLALVLIDGVWLPKPETFSVTRAFLDSPQLGIATRVELRVRQDGDSPLDVRVMDDLHPSLVAAPVEQRVEVFPREAMVSTTTIYPCERGDFAMGQVFLRYRGAFKMVERWAVAAPAWAELEAAAAAAAEADSSTALRNDKFEALRHNTPESGGRPQRVRVFPAHEDSRESTQFYLLRARQIEMQKRKLRLRGVGREFESMRDYQPGDELRKISWTATARRGRLVTRQFTVERSQQVWVVIDAGRLSRTAFELRRGGTAFHAETDVERETAHLLTVTQLDQATTAATMLAQVINSSGDKFAMMTYGRTVQQMLSPGAGAAHLRLLIDLLSQTRSEAAEADHLNAIARLKMAQRRRGLIVWITELVDSAGRPELVTAASELVRQHLVVLVLLKHPELEALAGCTPKTADEMFHSAAAQEMLERRRETIAQLERQGVLIVETTAAEVGVTAVSKYLEVKAEGRL